MKIKNVNCPNCKASLEMNPDKLMMYCPYCRTKLPMDFDVDNYISEKEETERAKEVTKRKEMDIKQSHIAGIAIFVVMIVFIILLMISFKLGGH